MVVGRTTTSARRSRASEEGRADERGRPQPAPDPPEVVRWSHQPDPPRIAARLEPDWAPDSPRRRPERPAGPHRRCRFREPEYVRRPDPDPELHPRRRRGSALQPVPCHGVVLPDACSAPDWSQQPRGRLRVDRRVRGWVPGLLRDSSPRLRAVAPHSSRQRLQHGRVRQMAPDSRRSARSGRPVRSVAERLGLRLLLRDSRRRFESVGSVSGREPEDHRDRPAVLRRRRSVLLPGCDGRSHDRVVARDTRAGRAQTVLRVLLDRM